MVNKNTILKYVITCDQAVIDQTGKASFIGVFEQIKAISVPAIHSSFALAISILGNPETFYNQKIEIINEKDNKSIIFMENKLKFEKNGGSNFIGNFINTVFPVFGKYYINIFINDELVTDPEKHYVLVEKN